MRRGFAAVVMATVLLVGASAVWAAPNAVTLEMKGEPGQELRYSTTFSMSLDLDVQDPESGKQVFSLAPRMAGSAVAVSRVADVAENGDLSFAGRVESFDFSLDVADLHARLAIVGPDGGAPQLIKLPEIPLRTVISKAGKLVAIEGLENLPIPPIPGPNGQSIDLKGMMSKVTGQFSQPLFPDRPVSVGDTWQWEMVIEPLKMAEMMGTPAARGEGAVGRAVVPDQEHFDPRWIRDGERCGVCEDRGSDAVGAEHAGRARGDGARRIGEHAGRDLVRLRGRAEAEG